MIFKYLGTLAIGIMLGQAYMIHGYNPDVLEEHALLFATESYNIGCKEAPHGFTLRGRMVIPEYKDKICSDKARKYEEELRPIWHNVAWKKF